MKVTEKEMINALESGINKRVSTNTEVYNGTVYLHGNAIIKRDPSTGHVYVRLSGWNSVTTRSRLRAVGANVCCKDFTPYINGKVMDLYKWYAI